MCLQETGVKSWDSMRIAKSSVASACMHDPAFVRTQPGHFALRALYQQVCNQTCTLSCPDRLSTGVYEDCDAQIVLAPPNPASQTLKVGWALRPHAACVCGGIAVLQLKHAEQEARVTDHPACRVCVCAPVGRNGGQNACLQHGW